MNKNDNILLAIGMITLTIAILLGRYAQSMPYVGFIEGLLYGLSLTTNLGYLIKRRNKS